MRVPALPGHETRGDRLSGLGAGQLPGARLRPARVRADRHRRARPAAGARAARQAALAHPDRRAPVPRPLPRVRVRGERAHVVPRRQPRLLERHQRVLPRRGRAGAPLPRDGGAAAALGLAGGDRAGAGGAARATPTRPPTSTSWSTRRSRSARTRRARSRSGARSSSWRCTAATTPTSRAWSTSCAASSPRPGGSSAASRSTATCSSCTRCRSRSGGLEHRASVTMDIAGLSFEDEAGYRRFADLAAHEFFHAWNVKRIHDAALGRFDYTRENYTRLLWFFEGFTDYLAHIIMLRAGRHAASATSTGCSPRTGRSTRRARAQRDAARRAVVRGLDQAVQAVGELHQPRGQLLRARALGGDGAGPRAAPGDGGPARPARDVPPAVGALRRGAGWAIDRSGRARRGRGDRRPALGSLLRPLHPRHRRAGPAGAVAARGADGRRRAPSGTSAASRPPTAIACARGARGPGPASTCIPSGCWSGTSSPTRPPGAPASPSATTSSRSTARA